MTVSLRLALLSLLSPVALGAQQVRITLHRDSAGVVVLTQDLLTIPPVAQVCPVPVPAPVPAVADELLRRLIDEQRERAEELGEELALLRTQLAEQRKANIVERATPWAAIAAAVGVVVTAVKK